MKLTGEFVSVFIVEFDVVHVDFSFPILGYDIGMCQIFQGGQVLDLED